MSTKMSTNAEIIPNFKAYMGNPNLKRAGIDVNWTPEMVTEMVKCSQDVVYFVSNYMKIVNVDKGLIPFTPYDYQIDMLKAMAENRYNIIATSRQAGKSTTTCAFILWYILFNNDKTEKECKTCNLKTSKKWINKDNRLSKT